MSDETRKSIFEKLFGKDEAAKARADLQDAQKLLDQMGLERKEDNNTPEGDVGLVDQVLQGVLEQLSSQGVIDAAIAAESAPNIASEDDFMQMVAEAAMNVIEAANHAAPEMDGEDMPPEDNPPEDDMPPEEDADQPVAEEDKTRRPAGRRPSRRRRELDTTTEKEHEDTDMTEETHEEPLEGMKALETRLTELTDTMAKSIEDQGELAKAILALTEIAPVVKSLQEDMTAVKEFMALTPSQASKSADTLFDDEKAKTEMLKSIRDDANTFLGMPLAKG